MNIHKYARLTQDGREILGRDIEDEALRVTEAAHASRVGVRTAYKRLARYRAEGRQGLWDRSSRPHRTSAPRRAQVVGACVAPGAPTGTSAAPSASKLTSQPDTRKPE